MTGLLKLQPIDPRASIGPKTTVRANFAAGARLGIDEVGFTPDKRLENEVYADVAKTLPEIAMAATSPGYATTVGMGPTDLNLSQDLVDRIRNTGFQPDEATLSELIGELERQNFEVPDALRPETLSARREKVKSELKDRRAQDRNILERGGPVGGVFGEFAGRMAAEFTDPVNLATLPVGASARAGILATMGIEAAVNGTIEGLQTPGRNRFLAALGEEQSSLIQNILVGAGFGAVLGGAVKIGGKVVSSGADLSAAQVRKIGSMLGRKDREAIADIVMDGANPAKRAAAQIVKRDVQDEAAAMADDTPDARQEHQSRAQAAREAIDRGEAPDMPDRPVSPAARPADDGSILVDPNELLVQPEVFQFKSDVVAPGGVTAKLKDVTEWVPHRAGITLVYEYGDGRRAVADGHQRTALAKRIMAQDPTQKIRLRAEVFREADGYTPEDIRVIAAMKNISEAADGMTAKMAGDAAKVLRLKPDEIANLPKGPGIRVAQDLSALSDDAFALFINDVIPQRYAAAIGRMVNDPAMHLPIARLLERADPETIAQAESMIAQALEAPVSRETVSDLFGESEIMESLFLEQAKVLERATAILRADRSVFKTLTDSAGRIEGTGSNKLDAATNTDARKQIETALAAVQKLAHRAGPISEALRNGAKSYKENGRLKDAGEAVADAVRGEVQRNGLDGLTARGGGRNAKPQGAGAAAPDEAEGFSDPVGSEAQAQVQNTRIEVSEPVAAADPVTDLKAMGEADRAVLEGELKAAQGFADVDDLMARGAVNHDDLTATIAAVADGTGVTARAAPLKGRERTQQKIDQKYAGDLNRVTDVARGGVDAPTPEAADAFVRALSENYRVLDEGWNMVEGGYFDRKLTVVFADGQLGEVQIWVPGMFEVKEGQGHKLYEIARDMTQPEAARNKARVQMEELYLGILDGLPNEWRAVLADQAGSSAPSRSSTDANTGSETSGEPSSPNTSRGSMADQANSDVSNNIEPGSGSTAGIERSTRKNLTGDTSNAENGSARTQVNTEATAAGEQGLIAGVAPISQRERLEAAQNAPKRGGNAAADDGLFDLGARDQMDLLDQVPVGRGFDEDGNEIALTTTRAELAAELDADDEFADQIGFCLK